MPKEKRPVRIEFQLTGDEYNVMKERMKKLGITNASAFVRRMVLNGYMFCLNTAEIHELVSLLRYTGNNLNQIARRINSTGRIYGQDLDEIRAGQDKIWNGVNEILEKLGQILKNSVRIRT